MVLRAEDLVNSVKYVLGLASGNSDMYVDDTDHRVAARLGVVALVVDDDDHHGTVVGARAHHHPGELTR